MIARILQDIGLLVIAGAALWIVALPFAALVDYRRHQARSVRR